LLLKLANESELSFFVSSKKQNGYLMHFVKSGVNIADDYHAQNLIGCVMVSVGSNRMKPKTKSYF